ncbi:MAG: hypothetical protein ABEI52_03115 [Halobacteriaceae archaeon]
MTEDVGSKRELTLYRCPHCTVEWAGPDVDDNRICECHHTAALDDTKWRLKPVGTVEVESDGWTRLGPAVETLQKGYAVLYENEHRYKQKCGGHLQDLTTGNEPVPGQIIAIEETRYGPRYEIRD